MACGDQAGDVEQVMVRRSAGPVTQHRAAELVGHTDAERVRAELVRLDRTAQALTPVSPADADAELAQDGL